VIGTESEGGSVFYTPQTSPEAGQAVGRRPSTGGSLGGSSGSGAGANPVLLDFTRSAGVHRLSAELEKRCGTAPGLHSTARSGAHADRGPLRRPGWGHADSLAYQSQVPLPSSDADVTPESKSGQQQGQPRLDHVGARGTLETVCEDDARSVPTDMSNNINSTGNGAFDSTGQRASTSSTANSGANRAGSEGRGSG